MSSSWERSANSLLAAAAAALSSVGAPSVLPSVSNRLLAGLDEAPPGSDASTAASFVVAGSAGLFASTGGDFAAAPPRIAIIASAEGGLVLAPAGPVDAFAPGATEPPENKARSFEQAVQRPVPMGLHVSQCPQTIPISCSSPLNVSSEAEPNV